MCHFAVNLCLQIAVFLHQSTFVLPVLKMISELLSRYDYLEFTDAAGNKTRFDHKVNTDKWPLTKVFSPGPRLHFLFHSDSSNNEWGYKFRVPSYYLYYLPTL